MTIMGTVALEEAEFMKDSKYRLYVNAIDKALKSFEYSSEWADLISALGKLNKVLVSYSKYPVIPRRIKISKRLAQCMHPALPSGVHLKALETYDIIFRNVGTSRLSQELFIYSAGLFPLLVNAATNVKQTLLTIYETHFVPLCERLGPGLSGFLSGVLLGLEEGSDYFNRTNGLLEKVCEGVTPVVFYGHLWECLASNAAVRLPAILFVLSHFDKSSTIDTQSYIVGVDINIMVNALCACFHDTSVLVQRNGLDFLLVAFPMHNNFLQTEHLQKLVTSALVTILRRDMSLNRRLYAWLLGSEANFSILTPEHSKLHHHKDEINPKSPDMVKLYFEIYSRILLVNAIKEILNKATSQNPHDLRPYRILVSLLDKTDIGPVILDDILFEVFRLLYLCSKNPGDKASNNAELLKNANLLFSSLEPRYLWHYVGVLFSEACQNLNSGKHVTKSTEEDNGNVKAVGYGQPEFLEVCDLISFLLDSLALELYSETLTEYLPELFSHIITVITEDCDCLSADHVATALRLSIKILSQVRLPILVSNRDLSYGGGSFQHNNNNNSDSQQQQQQHVIIKGKISEPGKIVQLKSSDANDSNVNNKAISINCAAATTSCSSTTASIISNVVSKDGGSLSGGLKSDHHLNSLDSDTTSGIDTPSSTLSLDTLSSSNNNNASSLSYMSDFDSITSSLSAETLTIGTTASSSDYFNNDDNKSSRSTKQQQDEVVNNAAADDGSNGAGIYATTAATATATNSETILDKCLRQYEIFYVTFMYGVRVKIGEMKNIDDLFQMLKIKSPNAAAEDRAKHLEELLQAVLYKDQVPTRLLEYPCSLAFSSSVENDHRGGDNRNNGDDECDNDDSNQDSVSSPIKILNCKRSVGMEWTDAVYYASKLLLELSTFQTTTIGPSATASSVYDTTPSSSSSSVSSGHVTEETIPDWLKALVVYACWLGNVAAELQFVTISTMLDLSSLCRRTCSHIDASATSGVTSVLIIPLMKPIHLSYIENNTNIFQVIAHWLWYHLGNPLFYIRSAELLHQLQNLLYLTDVVENCIGESLSCKTVSENERLFSFRKFVILWHIGREITLKSSDSVRTEDIFYRSMLKMLDNLQLEESNCLRVETENWLYHIFLTGDSRRLFEPLFTALLDASAARISIIHAKVQRVDGSAIFGGGNLIGCDNECYNNDILPAVFDKNYKLYAVTSGDGVLLIYHLSTRKSPSVDRYGSSEESLSTHDHHHVNDNDRHHNGANNIGGYSNISQSDYYMTKSIQGDFDDYLDERSISSEQQQQSDNNVVINVAAARNFKTNKSDSSSSKKSKRETSAVDENNRSFSLQILKNSSFPSLDNLLKSSAISSSHHMPLSLVHSSTDLFNLPLSSFKITTSKLNRFIGATNDNKQLNNNSFSNEGLTTTQKEKSSSYEIDGEQLMTRSYSFSGGKKITTEFDRQSTADDNHQTWSMSHTISNAIVSEIVDYVLDKLERSEKFKQQHHNKKGGTTSDVDVSTMTNIASPSSANKDIVANSGGEIPSINVECSNNVNNTTTNNNVNNDTTINQQPHNASNAANVSYSELNPLHSHMMIYYGVYDSSRMFYIFQTVRNILATNCRAFIIAACSTVVPSKSYLFQLFVRHRKAIFGRAFTSNIDSHSLSNRNVTFFEVLLSSCLYYIRGYYPNFAHVRLTEKELHGNRQVQIASVELLGQLCSHLCPVIRECGSSFAVYLLDLFSRSKMQKIVLYSLFSNLNTSISDESDSSSFTQDILNFNNERTTTLPAGVTKYLESLQIHLLRLLLSLILVEYEIQSRKKESDIGGLNSFEFSDLEYVKNGRIPQQPIFYAALMTALEPNACIRHLHQYWTSVVIYSLPYFKKSLVKIVSSVVQKICDNLECTADAYNNPAKACFPSDYAITQMGTLTILCHYCLLDANQAFGTLFSHSLPGCSSTPSHVFTSIMHILNPTPMSTDTKEDAEILQNARKAVLNTLPKIVGSLSILWKAVALPKQKENENNVAGNIQVVRNQIIQLLNPIVSSHNVHFLAAIALVWNERKSSSQNVKLVTPEATDSQQILIHLINALKCITADTLVHTVHQVVKQASIFEQETSAQIEVGILEFLIQYTNSITVSQLSECWPSLLPLLREASSLAPPSQFLLFIVLNQFVNRTSSLRLERKDQKDVQDIIAKLAELCSQTAGACLEQTTWLRRNLAVRDEEPPAQSGGFLSIKDSDKCGGVAQYSLTAQTILAQLLAPLLDVGFGSQEKERVVTLLTNLMYNVTPYLKNHTQKNAASFYACSQLLANLSSYQYTRKAWKKDAMDLLLDSNLFQMEAKSLTLWRMIVDNLMSQDMTTFRDLLTRISTSQGNSLNLFSSRDLEYEQRGQFLKRLAFVILCSDEDQFHKHMPDIQEKLADSLRLPQSLPSLQAQVFLCFRVLLLRMSPDHVTSLWPVIVTELIQVLLHMENDLSNDSEESSSNNGGLHNSGHPQWLQLPLAAAKLLKLAIQLPVDRLPQFQMYRWAFVSNSKYRSKICSDQPKNNVYNNNVVNNDIDFVPHVTRITRLMDKKFGGPVDSLPAVLLPSGCGIRVLQDLHPFFSALSKELPEIMNVRSVSELEHEIELDFIEPMPSIAR